MFLKAGRYIKVEKTVKYLLLSFVLISGYTFAGAECEFKPTHAKVGESGRQESKLFVCDSAWSCYNLGLGNDPQAKNRYSTIMTALMADKKIRLRFYGEPDCATAKSRMTVPTSTWLIK